MTTKKRTSLLATALLGGLGAGCSSSHDLDKAYLGAVDMCFDRAADSLDSSQHAFTPKVIRWMAQDVAEMSNGAPPRRGQEYTEYFAIVKDLEYILADAEAAARGDWGDSEGYTTQKINDGRYRFDGGDDLAVLLSEVENDQEVGKCVFTSWHRDVDMLPQPYELQAGEKYNSSEKFLFDAAEEYDIADTRDFRMQVGFNSNAAAGDLLANCLHPSDADLDPFTLDPEEQYARGCFNASPQGSAGFGTEWRRSDSAVCVVGNRLAECGCQLDVTADDQILLSLPMAAPEFGDPLWVEIWPLVAEYWSGKVGGVPRMEKAQEIRDALETAQGEDAELDISLECERDDRVVSADTCRDVNDVESCTCSRIELDQDGRRRLDDGFAGAQISKIEAETDRRRMQPGQRDRARADIRAEVVAEIEAEFAREFERMQHWYRQFIGAHVIPAATPDADGNVPFPGFRLGAWDKDFRDARGNLPEGCEYIRDSSYNDPNTIDNNTLVACPLTKEMLVSHQNDVGQACKAADYAEQLVVHISLDYGINKLRSDLGADDAGIRCTPPEGMEDACMGAIDPDGDDGPLTKNDVPWVLDMLQF